MSSYNEINNFNFPKVTIDTKEYGLKCVEAIINGQESVRELYDSVRQDKYLVSIDSLI
jgi:hypothetical protein